MFIISLSNLSVIYELQYVWCLQNLTWGHPHITPASNNPNYTQIDAILWILNNGGDVNTKFLNYTSQFFFIYTHPVNSKFKIWHDYTWSKPLRVWTWQCAKGTNQGTMACMTNSLDLCYIDRPDNCVSGPVTLSGPEGPRGEWAILWLACGGTIYFCFTTSVWIYCM